MLFIKIKLIIRMLFFYGGKIMSNMSLMGATSEKVGDGYYNYVLNTYSTDQQFKEAVKAERTVNNMKCCEILGCLIGTGGFVSSVFGFLGLIQDNGDVGLNITLLVLGILALLGVFFGFHQKAKAEREARSF